MSAQELLEEASRTVQRTADLVQQLETKAGLPADDKVEWVITASSENLASKHAAA